MLTNWKTTGGGVGAILLGIGGIITMLTKGQVDGTTLVTDLGLISAGFIGLFGKDANVTGGTIDNRTGATVPDTSPTANPAAIYGNTQRMR
jgi:hypothetical protein